MELAAASLACLELSSTRLQRMSRGGGAQEWQQVLALIDELWEAQAHPDETVYRPLPKVSGPSEYL